MINCCNCYRTDGKRNDCYYHIQAMTATLSLEYAAIVVSVLYRMLTLSIFGIFDYISSNILLPVGGILISIYVGWRFDRRLLEAELTNNGELKLWLLKPLIFILKYVAPLFILVILLHSLGLF